MSSSATCAVLNSFPKSEICVTITRTGGSKIEAIRRCWARIKSTILRVSIFNFSKLSSRGGGEHVALVSKAQDYYDKIV